MSINVKELDPMIEYRIQFAFKGQREHIATVNTPNIAYPGQTFNVIISQGSADHIIVPDTLKIRFDLELTLTDKACSVVKNVGKALVKKKKVLKLGSKEIDAINNACIYDAYKDLYLTEKEREERLLQGI